MVIVNLGKSIVLSSLPENDALDYAQRIFGFELKEQCGELIFGLHLWLISAVLSRIVSICLLSFTLARDKSWLYV